MIIHRNSDYPATCPPMLASRKTARVVRLESQVLWFPARKDSTGAALIDSSEWDDIRVRCPGLPPFAVLPRAKRRDILRAWMLAAPTPAIVAEPAALVALVREKLVACDHTELADAVAAVETLITSAEAAPDEPLSGRLAPPTEGVLTLYLDTSPTTDWPALARNGNAWEFAFAGGVAFTPEAISEQELAWTRSAQENCGLREVRQLTFFFL